MADWSNDMYAEKWNRQAMDNIQRILDRKANHNIAKNVILFLGDGMGISTVTSGRILKGQLKNRNGEEEITVMESFDNVALSKVCIKTFLFEFIDKFKYCDLFFFLKTYNIDAQTADSAGTATAYLTGVKTRIGVIGLDGRTIYDNCESSKGAEIDSIVKWAHDAGKSVGVVTTTRITHATPAGAFAHAASRDWEVFDGKVFSKKEYDAGCRDIASQLIDNSSYINVYL